jgi:hypothetical protein
MKTSAPDTQQIDRYLLRQLPAGDKLVLDAKLMLCPELQETAEWQRKVHQLVKLRGRRQLQQQIKAVEQTIFSQPEYSSFRQKIWRLFGK